MARDERGRRRERGEAAVAGVVRHAHERPLLPMHGVEGTEEHSHEERTEVHRVVAEPDDRGEKDRGFGGGRVLGREQDERG